MVKESSILEQDYIFLMQTKDEDLVQLVSQSVQGENVRLQSVRNSADVTQPRAGQIITFIIGSDIEDPVQSAQRLHALEENAKIILLARSHKNAEVLKEAIRFSPFIGTNVSCVDESAESAPERLRKILQDSLKAERYRAIIAETNSRISSSVTSGKQAFSQHFINKLLEIAPIGIAIVGREGNILGWNKEATSIFDKNEAQVLGTRLYRLFGSSQGRRLEDFLKNRFKGAKAAGSAEPLDLERTSGTSRQILNVTAAPFTYSDDPEKILVLVIKDITQQVIEREKRQEIQERYTQKLEEKIELRTRELKKANKKLVQKNDELVKINKELDEFAYVASHDLQEPLRKIQVFAGRIIEKEKTTLSEKGKRYFNLMQDATNRMQTLIEDLLAFSRLTTSERKFERTDLNTLIQEVKDTFKETVKEKNARIETEIYCEADIIVFQFRQLMYNLISNALKFSKPGEPPRITIKCRRKKGAELNHQNLLSDMDYCHLSVADNGIGFEDEFKKSIFEVFQRLHSKDEYPGTGIGLATVKKVVDIHEGIITAKSEVNKGTTFNIYLPVSSQ